jgi:enoyl-CoA hydratase/carnithine racemase
MGSGLSHAGGCRADSIGNIVTDEAIHWEVTGGIARIIIDRPAKLNTITPAMGQELTQLVQRVNGDEAIRVVILSGTGERAFSAGSDVSVLDDYGTNWQLRNRVDYARAIWAMRKPVISKIRGYCIGGGLEMALMSDLRYCDDTAQFGAGEIKLGWHGGAGNTQLLPRVAGPGIALEMLLTGDLISAEEAVRVGLVQRIYSSADLDAEVEGIADRISRSAPIAAELAKHLVRISQSTSLDVGLAYENDTFTYCFTTEDSQEGRQAFAEKRPPHFRGR